MSANKTVVIVSPLMTNFDTFVRCLDYRYRGGSGPLHVTRGKTNHPLHHAFIEAGQQTGYPFTDDMNGYQQEGVGWMDMTVYKG